uniref:RING-type E3 ubiquitin transferase n=1 Tax=Cyprinus carpio carpio TaxID=630221 RepID=A0A9J7X4U6_CYPCA
MAESSPTSRKARKARGLNLDHKPPFMSSSISSLTEELQCSICLDVFTDPVSTPCGHNFCKTCLNEHWDNSQTCSCPYCKETFKQRPDLKINTTLQEIVDHYKKKSPEKKPEVLCDICEERKLKALKLCLSCQRSYCETHLEPHLRVAGLKKHKLMDPVSNLKDYICQKHESPLHLFCRDDQIYVCLICSVKDHENHNTVPIEEESEEKKTELMKIQKDLQQMIQDRIKKIQDIKQSAEVRKGFYTELLEMMEEQQKAAEKQEEELIEELEQEITELKMRNTELKQLSHTEDHLHLLQIHSSLCSPRNTRNWSEISIKTHESLETLRRDLTQLKDTIDEKLTLHVSTELKWMQQYAADVTLDPDTAHPDLILSDDRKQPSGLSGPRHSGQVHCGKEPRKIFTSVSLTEDVQLNKAKKVWKPSGKHSSCADEGKSELLKTQELFKCVWSVLNQLTPQMFQPLMKQMTELTINTEERLKGVIHLIYEKAISEPDSSEACANMCRCLMGLKVPATEKPGVTVNFRKLLLKHKKEFEKEKDDEMFEKQKELDAATGEEEKQRLKEDLEDAKEKACRRSLGIIKFTGELFKVKMLTEPIMHDCIVKLLKRHNEESLECLCCLLSTIWKHLDHEKAKPRMDQYLNQMKKIIKERKTSSRIRFMLQGVLDLRQAKPGV